MVVPPQIQVGSRIARRVNLSRVCALLTGHCLKTPAVKVLPSHAAVSQIIDLLDQLNKYNGLLTALWTLVLSVITFFYLQETRRQRIATETVLRLENARLRVHIKLLQHDVQNPSITLELETQNVGTRPLRTSSFKILTKRSPHESIENFAFPGTASDYSASIAAGHVTYQKDTEYLNQSRGGTRRETAVGSP